jgi:hypothetical protein
MATVILDTGFEGSAGSTTFPMAVGSISSNTRQVSATYSHSGSKSLRMQASESCYLNFSAGVSAIFDVVFWIFVPSSGSAWGSSAGLFRTGGSSSKPGCDMFVNGSTADILTVDTGTNIGTISTGVEHKLRFLCDGTTLTLYIDDVAQAPYTLSSSYSGGDTSIEMAHSGSDYYFGNTFYIDDLVVTSDPVGPPPPPPPPSTFWTGFVSSYEVL